MKIRQAVDEDMASVLSLVKELAIYENAENEVIIDTDYYKKAFADGVFDVIVATDSENKIIGIALFYMAFSTWKGKMLYLEDLVVAQEYRGLGIGQQLLDAVQTHAAKANCRLLKWQVLDWNEPAIRFYQKNKVRFDKEWWNCTIPAPLLQ